MMYWAGVAFYAVVCLLLVLSCTYKSMGLVNVLWSGVRVLIILSTGSLLFGETIPQLDMLGVVLVIAGIVCIVWEGRHD